MIDHQKYDDLTVREIVEDEGLDYAVRHYMSSDSIKSEETAQLWSAASDALEALAKHLHLDEE